MSSANKPVRLLTTTPSGMIEYSYNNNEIEFMNHGDDRIYVILKKFAYKVDLVFYEYLIKIIEDNKQLTDSNRYEKVNDEIQRATYGPQSKY